VIVDVCTRPRLSVGGILCHVTPDLVLEKAPCLLARCTEREEPGALVDQLDVDVPSGPETNVDGELFLNEKLGILAALGSADLNDHCGHD